MDMYSVWTPNAMEIQEQGGCTKRRGSSKTTSEDETRRIRLLSVLAEKLYDLIDEEGPISTTEAAKRLSHADRTVRQAVKALKDNGLIKQTLSFKDARVKLYYVK